VQQEGAHLFFSRNSRKRLSRACFLCLTCSLLSTTTSGLNCYFVFPSVRLHSLLHSLFPFFVSVYFTAPRLDSLTPQRIHAARGGIEFVAKRPHLEREKGREELARFFMQPPLAGNHQTNALKEETNSAVIQRTQSRARTKKQFFRANKKETPNPSMLLCPS